MGALFNPFGVGFTFPSCCFSSMGRRRRGEEGAVPVGKGYAIIRRGGCSEFDFANHFTAVDWLVVGYRPVNRCEVIRGGSILLFPRLTSTCLYICGLRRWWCGGVRRGEGRCDVNVEIEVRYTFSVGLRPSRGVVVVVAVVVVVVVEVVVIGVYPAVACFSVSTSTVDAVTWGTSRGLGEEETV